MEYIFNILNNNLFFSGCAMFIMNIGSKYIIHEIPDTIDYYFMNYKIFRYIVIFCIAFISTRNIKISILLTLVFILVFNFLIETNSKFCLIHKIPKKNNISNNTIQIDSNMIEYYRALEIIKKYNNR